MNFLHSLGADWQYRHLLGTLLVRRISARYRGTALGLLWAVVMPLIMLAVYTLVFEKFLSVRWPAAPNAGGLVAALNIYLGLLVLNFVGENLNSAPGLMQEHTPYIKKIVFPLPILAYVAALSSLLPLGIGLVFVALFALSIPQAEISHLPLILFYWLPLIPMAIGIQWWLNALGVYLRDLTMVMAPIVTLLMFISPVFYSLQSLPAPWNAWLMYNPLTLPIESARMLLFERTLPPWAPVLLSFWVAIMFALLGRFVFIKLQKGFADVL
jgi:lipopolysaccharide transport system permease protein